MSEQNNSSHWCKSVIETAQSLPAPYESYTPSTQALYSYTPQVNSFTQPAAGYGGVISSTTLSVPTLPVNYSIPHNYQQPQAYGHPSAVSPSYYPGVPTQNIPYSYPSQVYAYQHSLTYNTPTPVATSHSILPPQTLSSSPITQPDTGNTNVIYKMPHISNTMSGPTFVASVAATKKPNPERFATATQPNTAEPMQSSTSKNYNSTSSNDGSISQSLKDFIKRSIASCTLPSQRQEMTEILGRLVTKIKLENRLNDHKWELEPIPTLVENITPSPLVLQKQISTPQENISAPKEVKKRKSRFQQDDNGNVSLSDVSKELDKKKLKTNPTIVVTKSTSIPEPAMTPEEVSLREQRASRFHYPVTSSSTAIKVENSKSKIHNPVHKRKDFDSDAEFDIESLKIVGTCQVLEKDYFRLTSAPDPSTVRPLDVLKKALALIKRKWKNSEAEYIYICSQLKAVRQDLTVQNIRNELMVDVYETHARIALESNDLNEYNQCQTQLKQLYDSGISGSEMEFTAYRILYYVYLQGNKKYQKGSSDLLGILASLSVKAEKNPAVQHALLVREAIRRENYHKFFQLYKVTPNMGAYILDHMMDGQRLQVLSRMCKAYKPNLSLNWAIDELGFDNRIIGETFLEKAGCVISEQQASNSSGFEKVIITSESVIDPSAVLTQDKLLL